MKNQNSPGAERDWKYLSSIQKELLENFSRRGNEGIRQILCDPSLSENEKRLKIFNAVNDHNKEIQACFDGWSRSSIFEKTVRMRRRKIIEDRYYESLSDEMRKGIETVLEICS